MSKKIFFFILFILNHSLLQAKINTHFFDEELIKTRQLFPSERNFKKACFFYLNKNYDSTLIYTNKILNSKTKNNLLLDYTHFLRGTSFQEKDLFDKATKEYKLISKSFKFNHIRDVYLGYLYLNKNNFKLALYYLKKIELLDQNKLKNIDISSVYHNIGLCYLHLSDYKNSEIYLFKSLILRNTKKETELLINSCMDLANLYYIQYKDSLAIPYFRKAYQLSKKTTNFKLKQNTALNMAVVEENLKNYSFAIEYRKEYENWRDSLNDQNKVWEIAEKEKKFSVNIKEKEIKVLEAENKIKINQRNWLIYSFSLLIIIFIIGIYFYKQKIKTNKIILSQRNKLDELNATKDQLFSIVSHDLRSSVNALKTSNTKLLENLESQNYTELDKLLQNNSSIANGAYNLLDNLLNWALLQTKQLYFQKETLHLYSIIQQIEYNYKPLILNKNIRFENRVKKDHFIIADLDSFKIILRNVLDNAIKFCKDDDLISIYTLDTSENFHQLVIEDTGIGMSQETQSKLMEESILLSKKNDDEAIGTGLGFQLCKSMILKNDGEIRIESVENKGTKIILTIPKSGNNG